MRPHLHRLHHPHLHHLHLTPTSSSTSSRPKRIDEQCKLVAEGNTALREEYAVAMQVPPLLPSQPVPHPLV